MQKLIIFLFGFVFSLASFAQNYVMPAEDQTHEGTWLQWPHQYEYGLTYRNRLDATWVAMTGALVSGEKVHIIAYNANEQTRITNLLTSAGISLLNIDFKLLQTNDVWVRDNGPIFVKDASGNLNIEDWGFNGWGGDYNYNLCNPIPSNIGTALSIPVINLNAIMTVEGGSFEIDGNGTLLATKSSILTQNNSGGALAIRNPGMTQEQAETIFTQYIGATKFIWLDGFLSVDDITDAHIDGFAKFSSENTLVTMNNSDLLYWGLSSSDITTLYTASDVNNTLYNTIYVPLTQNDVVTTYGNNLGYKGSYCNYYIANNVVLVPNYNDPNDAVANAIIQDIHPNKTVIGIDCRNLYQNGGMVHCVTQQQPDEAANSSMNIDFNDKNGIGVAFPNPFSKTTAINILLKTEANVQLSLFNSLGLLVKEYAQTNYSAGKQTLFINTDELENGVYTYVLTINSEKYMGKIIVSK